MSHEQGHFRHGDQGLKPEALSNELLKLKIDDLFQEVESLKARVARLEGESKRSHGARRG
ncbi:hypothetical protein SAMN05444166_6244 [Singulisphaera sp. GP187]|uniref:hypothetical protein n=1 Tax=Singulisphaera sp. GP187 TaxID=1882752 RepID=UPI0009258873|nr:hypothetical protein [Singulisphaera sp. GP187]SIO60037.1 hypothetical protein SAMN05444166_6244 [Singulisphaera sp. GP187]